MLDSFLSSDTYSLKNGYAPKSYFLLLFWKILFGFFFKILLYKKYSKPHSLQKSLYWFLLPGTPFHSKWLRLPVSGFSQLFQHKLKNNRRVFLLKSILIWKKILWRINFVLAKFSLNVLFFKKLQNECENPSFHHKLTCRSIQAQLSSFTFMALILWK